MKFSCGLFYETLSVHQIQHQIIQYSFCCVAGRMFPTSPSRKISQTQKICLLVLLLSTFFINLHRLIYYRLLYSDPFLCFNYGVNINQYQQLKMLRLINFSIFFSYHKPRVMSIQNVLKRVNASAIEQNGGSKNGQNKSQQNQNFANSQKNDDLSIKDFKRAVFNQPDNLSKDEHIINHQIKIQTKNFNLYELYKHKNLKFTSKNLVNLIIKVLELRKINPKDAEQTQKFTRLIANSCKKIQKMSPQDMIRLLFCLKRIQLLNNDLRKISPLIFIVLKEFSMLSDNYKQGQFQSFSLISLQSNIKLLHSLQYLHLISGNQYEPMIVNLIVGQLHRFHKLIMPRKQSGNTNKFIKWYFIFSFIGLSSRYKIQLKIIHDFVKILNSYRKFYYQKYRYLFNLEGFIQNIMANNINCRDKNIGLYKQLFDFQKIIFQNLEKPNQAMRVKPLLLLKHLEFINNLTEEQIKILNFQQIREVTLIQILQTTNRVFSKYFAKNYANQVEKAAIEEWIKEGRQYHRQYLGEILILYNNLFIEKKLKNTSQFNKLLSLCMQFFQALSFYTQGILIKIAIDRQFKNSKTIIDIFFKQSKLNEQAKIKGNRRFKKLGEVQSCAALFPHWGKFRQITKFSTDSHVEGSFIKLFFIKIILIRNIEQISNFFSQRIMIDRQFFQLLIKSYIKSSQQNRLFGRKNLTLIQSDQFKIQLKSISQMIQNQNVDNNKLSNFAKIKLNMREKIKRALNSFKFFILLLQNINKAKGHAYVNITHSILFKQLYFHFNEELKCIFFKELRTGSIIDQAQQICEYLISKRVEQNDFIIFNFIKDEMAQTRKTQKIKYHKQVFTKYKESIKSNLIQQKLNIDNFGQGIQTNRLVYLNRNSGIAVKVLATQSKPNYLCLDQIINQKDNKQLILVQIKMTDL